MVRQKSCLKLDMSRTCPLRPPIRSYPLLPRIHNDPRQPRAVDTFQYVGRAQSHGIETCWIAVHWCSTAAQKAKSLRKRSHAHVMRTIKPIVYEKNNPPPLRLQETIIHKIAHYTRGSSPFDNRSYTGKESTHRPPAWLSPTWKFINKSIVMIHYHGGSEDTLYL